jgi:hypothetical protein
MENRCGRSNVYLGFRFATVFAVLLELRVQAYLLHIRIIIIKGKKPYHRELKDIYCSIDSLSNLLIYSVVCQFQKIYAKLCSSAEEMNKRKKIFIS